MERVYISIGSNIEREHNVPSGLAALRAHYGKLITSTVYESKAYGFAGDNFYNLVAGFDTADDLAGVIETLQAIEQQHGRVRNGPRFSSRTLDLDLLLYGNLVMQLPGLTLPRPEILKRAFVLLPLAEIAPELTHPVTGKTYRMLWEEFDKTDQEIWPVELAGHAKRSAEF
ncbi:MAG TPA: 2-amino-4-hydroxy-6-hydroxymethyldihydropteridine diphosphokinase [Gammaproteobacteria bacterium]|nr:2-amino-4-hydroxy-6-hydroxymethyldihydropteridine diphosphokinase [Gammaproteobacteria bacterium]